MTSSKTFKEEQLVQDKLEPQTNLNYHNPFPNLWPMLSLLF